MRAVSARTVRRYGLDLAAIALTTAIAGGSSAALAASRTIDGIPPRKFAFGAMAIGQAKDVDHARAEGLGLVPAPALTAYLNGVLAKLLAQSPVTSVPAKVYVRASGDWAAKTTADANIYVALGTLLRLDDEDEIAALLAHEAAHVILGHADADLLDRKPGAAACLDHLARHQRRARERIPRASARLRADRAHVVHGS